MSDKSYLPLGAAGRIAVAMYVVPLVVLPLIGTFVKAPHPYPAASMRLLAPILAVVAVGDYIASLVVERSFLRSASERGIASGPAVALIVAAAFGVSIALYGFILSVLGAARWPLFFYALCFIHGVHLLARAQSYPRPAGS
jgi:hypothetical protein